MKLNLRFLTAAFIVMMIYTSAVKAQANLAFGGGSGDPLQITLHQSVIKTLPLQLSRNAIDLLRRFQVLPKK